MQKVVVLTKRDAWSEKAGQLAKIVFGDRLLWIQGTAGDPLPRDAMPARIDHLISFLSPWIVPKRLLSTADVSINFHPASRDYPGTGCYNFCLYEGAPFYGAVCHHMVENVDRGGIIEERRFPVLENETVETLKFRTMIVMLALYHDILSKIAAGQPLPEAAESWSRRPFTRAQLNELCMISPNMGQDEIARRVRATVYPGRPGPTVVLAGTEFRYDVPNRDPLA
jgi:methionyl-tRNA formyltransferase